MAILMERGIQYTGAMGSEGAHWIGLSPFVDTPHIFQNLGDGTYFHSGRLGVRACVEAGVRITFKILHNHRIAMTGGQEAVGRKPIAAVVRDLLSDGVRLVVAVSDDPELRSLAQTNPAVECVPRHRYTAAMQRLATEPGVTALVYDELCANEKQRLEKRGELPRPTRRPVINEDVCEGCGDCGARSACLSVRPVQTELGPKRRIHLTSCTDDLTCLEGDCPSFLSIGNPPPPEADRQRWIPHRLPAPPPHRWGEDPYRLFLVGVGSTGVVTANAILMRAAELEGHHAHHLDQMGLAQRGGRVLSQCTLGRGSLTGSPRVGWGLADTLLAFDPLGASDASGLRALSPERTWAIVHSGLAPTAEMVTQTNGDPPDVEDFIAPIEQHTMRLHTIPAESLAEAVFGTSLPANVIQLGFSCQLGAIPLRPESLEQAIVDREVAVEDNRTAFRLGRAVAADPSLVGSILADELPPTAASPRSLEDAAALLGETWHRLEQALEVDPGSGARSELLERIGGLALELGEYQDDRYAQRYLETLIPLAQAERNVDPTSVALTEAAARELYRLMAYKDEYEVARLLMSGPFRRWLERRAAGPLGLRYHLSPLLLRALGLKRKIAVGGWVEPVLRTLAACRRLRGTFLDPFGWMPARRLERELVSWYEGVLATLVGQLTPGNVDSVLEIVRAPTDIRGFDEIKRQRAAEVRRRVTCLVADLTGEPQREESA
jgi:indolepyruvate ferredoxin oxidoreductase